MAGDTGRGGLLIIGGDFLVVDIYLSGLANIRIIGIGIGISYDDQFHSFGARGNDKLHHIANAPLYHTGPRSRAGRTVGIVPISWIETGIDFPILRFKRYRCYEDSASGSVWRICLADDNASLVNIHPVGDGVAGRDTGIHSSGQD